MLSRYRLLALFVVLFAFPALAAPRLEILLPLGRIAYQTNELIDVSVIRSDTQALPAAPLTLMLTGDDGGKAVFTFSLAAVPLVGNDARATEHYHLNGWLLRPGAYTVAASAYDASAQTPITIHSHLRKSPFRLLEWGSRAKDQEQALLGEDSLGFNTNYAMYGGISLDNMIRGGVDFMRCCSLGGAHQIGMRWECDWSDPYVLRGAVNATSAFEALKDRTAPNCIGVHLYDEPGLSWRKDENGVDTPFNLPSQDRSYLGAFGETAPQADKLNAQDPAARAKFMEMARFKFGFMDATWKGAAFEINQVDPNLLTATQSVYGFWAYADGYYFNVVRSLPMISGHGGYSDWGPCYFHPSLTYEYGRMRDLNKPYWYLPAWNGGMPSTQIRMEQYLTFMQNAQGLMIPPDQQVQQPYSTVSTEGVIESNKTMSRLGTIFSTMPVTRPPVAILYSISQALNSQVDHAAKKEYQLAAYGGDRHTLDKQAICYIASKMAHISLFPIVEEDILDGTLAANHKTLVIPGVHYLDPKVIHALDLYIKNGGVVLVSDDSQVVIPGAVKLGVPITVNVSDKIAEAWKTKNEAMQAQWSNAGAFYKEAAPVAKALAARLHAAGIEPVLACDNPEVVVSRQALGDIEYFFAVNAAYDEKAGGMNSIKATTANIAFPAGGPIYDAVRGGSPADLVAPLPKPGQPVTAALRFGAGEMRAFARTARLIGGLRFSTPTIYRDYTVAQNPLRVRLAATLVDTNGEVLSGSAPLEIKVADPLGEVRYDLYRATDGGTCELTLPLAVNDPAGAWTVTVTDLLGNTTATTTFTTTTPAQCGALAGATTRAVYFGNDRDHVYRFFRNHKRITIITGAGDYTAAAERLTTILKPWGVICSTIKAADVKKREVDPEALKTWGAPYGGYRFKPEDASAVQLGYDVPGSALLLGTPEDNPLIKVIRDQPYNTTLLPYTPKKDVFPGRGRGYLAWQRDVLSFDGDETITLIAYDPAGMNEAIGTLYEMAAGLDPLTPLTLPDDAAITAAGKKLSPPALSVAWQVNLPDRAVKLSAERDQVQVLTLDGTQATLNGGKLREQKVVAAPALVKPVAPVVPDALKAQLAPMRLPKVVQTSGDLIAIGYWGGTLQVFTGNVLQAQLQLPQDISGLVWDGRTLVAALADGRVLGLSLPR